MSCLLSCPDMDVFKMTLPELPSGASVLVVVGNSAIAVCALTPGAAFCETGTNGDAVADIDLLETLLRVENMPDINPEPATVKIYSKVIIIIVIVFAMKHLETSVRASNLTCNNTAIFLELDFYSMMPFDSYPDFDVGTCQFCLLFPWQLPKHSAYQLLEALPNIVVHVGRWLPCLHWACTELLRYLRL